MRHFCWLKSLSQNKRKAESSIESWEIFSSLLNNSHCWWKYMKMFRTFKKFCSNYDFTDFLTLRLFQTFQWNTCYTEETYGFFWDNENMKLKRSKKQQQMTKILRWRLHPSVLTLQSCWQEVDRLNSSRLSASFTDFITHNSLPQYGRDIIRLIMCKTVTWLKFDLNCVRQK